jgi:hypothetical protein
MSEELKTWQRWALDSQGPQEGFPILSSTVKTLEALGGSLLGSPSWLLRRQTVFSKWWVWEEQGFGRNSYLRTQRISNRTAFSFSPRSTLRDKVLALGVLFLCLGCLCRTLQHWQWIHRKCTTCVQDRCYDRLCVWTFFWFESQNSKHLCLH